jgi:hypothetical protein
MMMMMMIIIIIITINIVFDDDNNNNNNNNSLLLLLILDKNLTRSGFVCMTATFRVVDMVPRLVILCSCLLCLR